MDTEGKKSRLIIVGPSWYGRWVEYIYPEYRKLGVDTEVVYTNSVLGSSSGHKDTNALNYLEKFKWILRRTTPAVFRFLKKLKINATEKELLKRVRVSRNEGKEPVVMFIWTPPQIKLLEKLKSMGVKMVLWQGEHWIREPHWKDSFKYFDHIFCVDERWASKDEETQQKLSILPLASTPDSFSPIELSDEDRKKYECDVVFVGLYKPQRAEKLAGLKDLNLRIYGHGWEGAEKEFPWLEGKIMGPADLADMPRIFTGAKICIGSLGAGEENDYENLPNLTQRVFDVALVEGFQVGQWNPQTEEYFGDSIPFFKTGNELTSLVKKYLSDTDERKKMAKMARDIALKNTWEDRVKESMVVFGKMLGVDAGRSS